MKYTPEHITHLEPDEIFVFGSNLAGCHGGGAAKAAFLHFGAVMGQGVGLQGQSYAIPTMQGGVETIRPYVDEFVAFADDCDQNTFLVTPIGCGIAGFTPDQIAPLFADALPLYNVRLPESFVKVICSPRFNDSLVSAPLESYTLDDMLRDYAAVICRFRPYLLHDPRLLSETLKERVDGLPSEIYTPVRDMLDAAIEPSPEGLLAFAREAESKLSESYPYYTPYLRFQLRRAVEAGEKLLLDSGKLTPESFPREILNAIASLPAIEEINTALSDKLLKYEYQA